MPTLEARVVGIEQRQGGYIRIETDSQPRFLDTKHDALIDEAYRLLDERSVAILRYSESESRNTNPNTGRPYTNRYFEGVASGDGRGQEADVRTRRPEPRREREREPDPDEGRGRREPPPPTESYGYRTHPETAWRIALTSGSERAMQTLLFLPPEERDGVDFEQQKLIALAWARFYMNTPIETRPDDDPADEDEDPIPF
jgi:hypothetical protein